MTRHPLFVIEATSYSRDGHRDVKHHRQSYEVMNDVMKIFLNYVMKTSKLREINDNIDVTK